MKVLLLNSPWVNNEKEYGIKSGTRWAALRKRDSSMPYFPFPDFMACTASFLRKAGIDAHIKDAVAEEISREECLKYLEDLKPDLLVIEGFTPSINIDLAFMKEAKKRTAAVTAFCGAHPTAVPSEILKNDFVDFVLLGEYDATLEELCRFLSEGRKDLAKVRGIAYKENGSVKINQRRPVIRDLDKIPFPGWGELPMQKYNEPVSKYYPNARIVTSRGCPHNCIFCIEPLMTGRIYRKRSVHLVLEEIKALIEKYGVKEIFFDDALFTVPRAKEIAQAIIKNGIKIAWSCWMDWNIDLDGLKLIKKSGCGAIKFGVESANSEILRSINKPVHIENIKRLIKDCRITGILTHGSFMLGLPKETVKTMQDTLDLAFSLGLNSCQFTVATPLPGTGFYEMAVKNKWLATRDWSQFESAASPVIEYPHCTREDISRAIENARRRKVKQFFKNPVNAARYMWKLYRMKGARGFFKEVANKAGCVLRSIFCRR